MGHNNLLPLPISAKHKQTHIPTHPRPHTHAHTRSHLPFLLLSLSLSLLHNQAWFPPHRKTSLFPHCLHLSAILCGPLLNSAYGQKYPHMAPLNGTGHTDHRHTALKIQRSSATAPLVHSLALTRLGNRRRERNSQGPGDGCENGGDAMLTHLQPVGVEKHRPPALKQLQISSATEMPSDISLQTKTSPGCV